MENETICALATAAGTGALGIIRVSGQDAFAVTSRCVSVKNLQSAATHTVHYGFFKDGEEVIDEVMVSVFRAPRTFTTEDIAEISFHGSPYIADRILQTLLKNGARLAKAGEFTLRAFLNGRIDLSQAEAIADLIASENEASRRLALTQLKGGITQEISILRTDLLNFASLVELELDFAEEDVEFADRSALLALINKLEVKIEGLLQSFTYGNAVKNGVSVAIIGKPNAGKSTLLNALLKEERAIVSDIAGTTRDTIEEVLHINGTAFRFVDTAGIRETTDTIEAIGVQKAREKIAAARILLFLFDAADSNPAEVADFVNGVKRDDLKTILLHNKTDLLNAEELAKFDRKVVNSLEDKNTDLLRISARSLHGIEQLKEHLYSYITGLQSANQDVVITNQRHFEALHNARAAVFRVKEAISGGISTELLAYELRNALEYLGEISGEFTNDELLGNIFSKFCIGK